MRLTSGNRRCRGELRYGRKARDGEGAEILGHGSGRNGVGKGFSGLGRNAFLGGRYLFAFLIGVCEQNGD